MRRHLLTASLGALLILATGPVRAAVNLVARSASPPAVAGGCGSLDVAGTVDVALENAGSDPAVSALDVLVFEDRDGDGLFTPGIDADLGATTVAPPVAPGGTLVVPVAVSGVLEFRDAPLHAWVDSGETEPESDETDNVASTAAACGRPPTTSAFELVVEWEWTGAPVLAAPLVGDVDADGVPDVVIATILRQIVCLDGQTGAEKWRTNDPVTLPAGYSTPALGQLDGDPQLEVVSFANTDNLAMWDADGSLVWVSPNLAASHPLQTGGVTLADIDCDGRPEALFGPDAINTEDGSLHWLPAPGGTWGSSFNYAGITSVADVDGDGGLEVIAGPTAYVLDEATGSGVALWRQSAVADGFTAVGQLDDDPGPEVVLVPPERCVLLEGEDGAIVWDVLLPWGRGHCNPEWSRGGPPTIGDLDGDGQSEIGIANSDWYVVLERDGSVKWTAPISDCSSAGTAGTFFDLDGDGAMEVIYQDEHFLHVFRGADGFELASVPTSSGTVQEMPTIADVDGDGRAEIVTVVNPWEGNPDQGVRVFGDRADAWAGARRLWNQHAYHVDNVNDDGTLPPFGTGGCEPRWWLDHDTYRVQRGSRAGSSLPLPDVTLVVLDSRVEAGTTCNPSLVVEGRVGNGGSLTTGAAIQLRFYDGDPAAGGVPVGSQSLPELEPGAWLPFSQTVPISGAHAVRVVADDDGSGTGPGLIAECREDNNTCVVPIGPDAVPHPERVGGALRATAHGDPRSADISGTFDWSGDEGLPRPAGDHYHLLRATRPDALTLLASAEPWTATTWEDVTPASPRRPTCHFLRVVAADACERTELPR